MILLAVSVILLAVSCFIISHLLFLLFSFFSILLCEMVVEGWYRPTGEERDLEETVLFDSSSSGGSGDCYTSFVDDCVVLLVGRKGFQWSGSVAIEAALWNLWQCS
jgi:hypothetical protein